MCLSADTGLQFLGLLLVVVTGGILSVLPFFQTAIAFMWITKRRYTTTRAILAAHKVIDIGFVIGVHFLGPWRVLIVMTLGNEI